MIGYYLSTDEILLKISAANCDGYTVGRTLTIVGVGIYHNINRYLKSKMTSTTQTKPKDEVMHITEEDVKIILASYDNANEEISFENYSVYNASDKMLGFLSDYWRVRVHLSNRKVLNFFIKSIPKVNEAKATIVKELDLYNKEAFFYSVIKKSMEAPGMKPWSARLITTLNDAMVFEDLKAKKYKIHDKFERFDIPHTLQALKTIARFHSSSIIFEINKTNEIQKQYSINDEYEQHLDKGGYFLQSDWYLQCMTGALEAMKTYSKYHQTELDLIEKKWSEVWSTALGLCDMSRKYRNVICHRDLWNNNIMFHYTEDEGKKELDDCLLVDFQAIRYQPPAGDVMSLLYCNLEPTLRENNMDMFLNFYYEELQGILQNYNIKVDDIMSRQEFMSSAEELRQWGIIMCACLIPQFWLDDDLTTDIFTDNEQFDQILNKRKGLFIKKIMECNSDYKQQVMEIFEEIADRYCLNMSCSKSK